MAVSQTSLGRYRLESRLAISGVAAVHRATDGETGKPVIVKVLQDYLAQERRLVERFFAALGQARALPPHPNILPPFEWGQDGESVWVAGPVAEGECVATLTVPVEPAIAVRIVTGVAEALEHALAHGVGHGNLKPANVFYDQWSGSVQLADFGMVVLGEEAPAVVKANLNRPHPAYTAPERIDGGEPNAASETFSLAVLAYWLLTGAQPFFARTPETMRTMVMSGKLTPASTKNPQLGPAIDDVLARALDPYALVRTPSPAAFAQALGSAIEKEADAKPAIEAAPIHLPMTEQQRREHYWTEEVDLAALFRRKRHRLTWKERLARIAGVLAVFAAGIAVYLYSQRPPEIAPATTALASLSVPARWELSRFDAANTGYVPARTSGIDGQVRWRFLTREPFLSAPATDGETVYAGTGDWRIVALDAANGAVRWEIPTTGPVDYSPIIAGDLLYVGLRDKRLLALDRKTGTERWSYFTDNPVSWAGVVTGGILYQGGTDERLYAFDAATGNVLWQFHTGKPMVGPPAVLNDLVVLVAQDGWVHVLDRQNGLPRFQYFIAGQSNVPLVAAGDTAYAAIGSGRRPTRLYAVDIRERSNWWDRDWYVLQGTLWLWGILEPPPPPKGSKWAVSLAGTANTAPALAHGRVYIGSVNKVLAFEQAGGKPVWEFTAASPVSGAPVVTDDTLYAGTQDGTLYALDPHTGTERWKAALTGGLRTSPALAGNALYLTSTDGTLFALR